MKNVALHNLGCKVNAYELEVMQQMLLEKGYNIVPFDQVADIYIVNTCTVTNIADRKSRQMLHRAKQKNPDAIVVAVGCYVQTGGEDVKKDAGIDLAIGNNRKSELVSILERFLEDRDKTLHGAAVTDIDHTYRYEEMTLKQTAEHTRAYIKIQDGCNQFCSYCLIPYARGRVRSRREENILAEVKGLAESGYREVVLTGIHISSYGIDFDGEKQIYNGNSRLVELVEKIHALSGIERIRLGSLEPRLVTEETVARLAKLPKLCPHFHLSLQSGCDETLKRMNRHYSTGEYYHSVELLRAAFDHPAITTDVIVGFPGETGSEYDATRKFLEKTGFYEMHIFKYSKRKGTRAAEMPDQVPDQVKTARSKELIAMAEKQSAEFRRRLVGRKVEVLVEETRDIDGVSYRLGHTKDYVKAAIPVTEEGTAPKVNELAAIQIEDMLNDGILLGKSKVPF